MTTMYCNGFYRRKRKLRPKGKFWKKLREVLNTYSQWSDEDIKKFKKRRWNNKVERFSISFPYTNTISRRYTYEK